MTKESLDRVKAILIIVLYLAVCIALVHLVQYAILWLLCFLMVLREVFR